MSQFVETRVGDFLGRIDTTSASIPPTLETRIESPLPPRVDVDRVDRTLGSAETSVGSLDHTIDDDDDRSEPPPTRATADQIFTF